MLRIALGLLAVGLVGMATAQTYNTPADQLMRSALGRLGQSSALGFVAIGTERIGESVIKRKIEGAWHSGFSSGGLQTSRAEFVESIDDVPVRRVVADGETLWAFDYRRNEYSAHVYGSHSGARPAGYVSNLLSGLRAQGRGTFDQLSRLLSLAFRPEGARYGRLLGGRDEDSIIVPPEGMPDPVNPSVQYWSVPPDQQTVLFWTLNPARSNAFDLVKDDEGAWNIRRIRLIEMGSVSGTARQMDWEIVLNRTYVPDDARFQFVPPAGSRPIVRSGG